MENEAWSSGSRNGHRRESVMGTELMTPYLSDGSNPLSRITLASLADLGYAVEFGAADAYTLPTETSIDMDRSELTHFSDDVHRGAVTWVRPSGTTLAPRHPDVAPGRAPSARPRDDKPRLDKASICFA